MSQNASMPKTRLTLPTMVYSAELVELSKVAAFEVVEDNGLYRLFFAAAGDMDRVGEALQVMREALS